MCLVETLGMSGFRGGTASPAINPEELVHVPPDQAELANVASGFDTTRSTDKLIEEVFAELIDFVLGDHPDDPARLLLLHDRRVPVHDEDGDERDLVRLDCSVRVYHQM